MQLENGIANPDLVARHRPHDDADGRIDGDLVALESEAVDRGRWQPLLEPVMRAGKRIAPAEPLAALRQHAAAELDRLPEALRSLEPATEPYPVEISAGLRELAAQLDRSPH